MRNLVDHAIELAQRGFSIEDIESRIDAMVIDERERAIEAADEYIRSYDRREAARECNDDFLNGERR